MDPSASTEREELLDPEAELAEQNAEQILRYARIAQISLAIMAVPLVLIFKPEHRAPLLALAALLFLFGTIGIPIVRRLTSTTIAGHLNWPLVLAAALVVVAITGGARSPFLFFTVIPLIGAARFGKQASLPAMALAVVGLAIVVWMTGGLSTYERVTYLIGYLFVASACFAVALRYVDVQRDAVLDRVTGLFNRHHMAGRIAELDINLTRGGRVAAVVIDLDRFKQVNDEYGHDRGDAVLRDFAYLVRANIREQDTAFRTGGEEFVVVLPGADLFTSRGVAERIREAAEQNGEMLLGVTASVGVAAATTADRVHMGSVLKAADVALYRAKREGRNRVRHATQPLSANGKPEAAAATGIAGLLRRKSKAV